MVFLVAQCSGLIEEFLGIASNRISVDLVSGKQPLLVWVQVKAESRGRTPRKSILIETAKPSKAKASETSYCESAFSGQHCDLPPFKTTQTHPPPPNTKERRRNSLRILATLPFVHTILNIAFSKDFDTLKWLCIKVTFLSPSVTSFTVSYFAC